MSYTYIWVLAMNTSTVNLTFYTFKKWLIYLTADIHIRQMVWHDDTKKNKMTCLLKKIMHPFYIFIASGSICHFLSRALVKFICHLNLKDFGGTLISHLFVYK